MENNEKDPVVEIKVSFIEDIAQILSVYETSDHEGSSYNNDDVIGLGIKLRDIILNARKNGV